MSELTRFETSGKRYKARIFERGSRKLVCTVCGQRRFVVLVRFIEPVKHERGICHECLVRLSDGMPPSLTSKDTAMSATSTNAIAQSEQCSVTTKKGKSYAKAKNSAERNIRKGRRSNE